MVAEARMNENVEMPKVPEWDSSVENIFSTFTTKAIAATRGTRLSSISV